MPKRMKAAEVTDQTVQRFQSVLENRRQMVAIMRSELYGELPGWVPEPSLERVDRLLLKLSHDGFSSKEVVDHVNEVDNDSLIIPGIVADSVAFMHEIHELAHLRYAIALGESKGLLALAGKQAEFGQRFVRGRKPGAVGPIRKAISELLAKNPKLKNAELWDRIASSPPKGWQESSKGMRLVELGGRLMGYPRFRTICGEERKRYRLKNNTV